MFFPRCCFRSVIALATSLLRSVAFRTDPTARRPAIVRSRFGHAVDVTGKWFVGGRWPVVRPPAPSDRRADRASLSSLVSAASLDLMTVPLPKTHRQSRPGLSLPLARGATAQALVSVRRVVSARAMVDVAPDLARRGRSVTSRRRPWSTCSSICLIEEVEDAPAPMFRRAATPTPPGHPHEVRPTVVEPRGRYMSCRSISRMPCPRTGTVPLAAPDMPLPLTSPARADASLPKRASRQPRRT